MTDADEGTPDPHPEPGADPDSTPDPATALHAERRPTWVAWLAYGIVLLAVLAWIGERYLPWITFGLFVYYVGRPVARRLGRRLNRTVAAAVTLAGIVVPVLALVAAFLAVAVGQALTFLESDVATRVLDRLPIPTTQLPTDPVQVAVVVLQDPRLSSVLGEFGVAVGAVGATVFNAFVVLIFAFFLLVDDARLAGWVERTFLGPESVAGDYARAVDRGLTSVYFGYTLTIFVVILAAAVIYTAFNLVAPAGLTIPTALLLAVVTGVFTLIPLVGRSIVYALIVGLLAAQALAIDPRLLWVPVAFFFGMVVVFDNLVRTYVRPALSKRAYDMSLVVFAYLLGPVLFGWYGIFLGPLVMVLVVEFLTLVAPRFVGVDARAAAVPPSPSPSSSPVDGPSTAGPSGPDGGEGGEPTG